VAFEISIDYRAPKSDAIRTLLQYGIQGMKGAVSLSVNLFRFHSLFGEETKRSY
jgi:hypothetical protein